MNYNRVECIYGDQFSAAVGAAEWHQSWQAEGEDVKQHSEFQYGLSSSKGVEWPDSNAHGRSRGEEST